MEAAWEEEMLGAEAIRDLAGEGERWQVVGKDAPAAFKAAGDPAGREALSGKWV